MVRQMGDASVRPRLVVGEVLAGRSADDVLALPEGAVRHLQVLRMQPGDEVWLLDGHGGGWVAQVKEMGRKAADVRLVAPLLRHVELPVRVTLVVGVPANDRMDALVEKATELGAWRIQPVLCERAVWRADGARAEKKVSHWQGVAQAAAEQSGRMVMPEIGRLHTFNQWMTDACARQADGWFVLDPRAERAWGEELEVRAAAGLPPSAHWLMVSGPEGGLTDDEVRACVQAGATAVRLGPRVLRADTAPLAVLASISARLER